MKKFLIPTLIFFLITTSFQLTGQQTESPSKAINWSQSLSENIDKKVKEYMEMSHTPGLALAIIKDGKVVKRSFYGVADISTSTPISEKSEFWLASVSKHLTTSLILVLEEEGVLSIEDNVSLYIPSLSENWDEIKIKHLMSHTSGIKDLHQTENKDTFLNQLFSYSHEGPSISEFEAILNGVNIISPPGEQFYYGDVGMMALAVVASEATKKPFNVLMQEYIFDPVKMSAYIFDPSVDHSDQVTGYTYANWELQKDKNRESLLTMNQSLFGGAGSLFVTLDDMIKWNQALNENTLFNQSSKELLYTKFELSSGKKINMGLGMKVLNFPGGYAVGHDGIAGTEYWKFPQYGIDLIILTNHGMNLSSFGFTSLIAGELGILDNIQSDLIMNRMQLVQASNSIQEPLTGKYKVRGPFPTDIYIEFFEKEQNNFAMIQGLLYDLIKLENGKYLGYSKAIFFPGAPLPYFEIENDNINWLMGPNKITLTKVSN